MNMHLEQLGNLRRRWQYAIVCMCAAMLLASPAYGVVIFDDGQVQGAMVDVSSPSTGSMGIVVTDSDLTDNVTLVQLDKRFDRYALDCNDTLPLTGLPLLVEVTLPTAAQVDANYFDIQFSDEQIRNNTCTPWLDYEWIIVSQNGLEMELLNVPDGNSGEFFTQTEGVGDTGVRFFGGIWPNDNLFHTLFQSPGGAPFTLRVTLCEEPLVFLIKERPSIPEPVALSLLGVGALALIRKRRIWINRRAIKMKTSLIVPCMLVVVLGFACPGLATDIIVIDDFEDSNSYAYLDVESEGTDFDFDEDTGLDPNHVIGGIREATLDGSGMSYGVVRVYINDPIWGGEGRLGVWASANAWPGATLELKYGTQSTSGAQLNADWSALDRIRMSFTEVGPNPTEVGGYVELFWNQGESGYGHDSVSFTVPDGTTNLDVSLSQFSGLDKVDIDAIRVEFGTFIILGQIFTLEEIMVIPEPAALALLAFGALVPMLSGLKRRWKS